MKNVQKRHWNWTNHLKLASTWNNYLLMLSQIEMMNKILQGVTALIDHIIDNP